MLSLLHKAYSGLGVESLLFDASCHDLCSSPQLFLYRAGEEFTSFCYTMDTILRLLEGLRRDELVWLNTYLTGRLRAMPPPTTAAVTVQGSAVPARAGTAGDSSGGLPVAALAERVGDFNVSIPVGADRGCTSRVGTTPAPDSNTSPGIYSATTP